MTDLFAEVSLPGAVLAPLVGAIVCTAGKRVPGRACRTATGLAWLSALLALVTVAVVALHGPFVVAVDGAHGPPLIGLWANQLTATLMLLVCTVGAVVQSFSLRYLQGDPTAPRFAGAAHVVVAAMAVVCTSATVTALVGAWVIAGVAFVVVLGCRRDLPGVRAATRRTARMLATGDVGLVVALVVIWVRAGNIDLVSPGVLRGAVGQLGAWTTLVAVLVAMAALSRSAQGPFGRWLPGTVSAPTPASALLHAGVVNGGGILLVRLGVLSGGSMSVMVGVLVVAGLTTTVATALMTHKPDVKGSLVFSTMSQMGFMVAECAVGAYLAAVVHLIGHGLYKATLFFGSGSQVPRAATAPIEPAPATPLVARVALSLAATAAAVGAMTAIPGMLAHRGAVVLLVFAVATAASASWAWSGRRPVSISWSVLWATAMLAAGALYGLILAGLGRWIAPAIPGVGAGALSPWWLVTVAVAGIAAAGSTRLPSARRRLVAVLVDTGAPPVQLVAGEGRATRAPRHAVALTASSEGRAA